MSVEIDSVANIRFSMVFFLSLFPSILTDMYHFRLHAVFSLLFSIREQFYRFLYRLLLQANHWISLSLSQVILSRSYIRRYLILSISNGNFPLELPTTILTNSTLKSKNYIRFARFRTKEKKKETRFKPTRRFNEQKYLFISINLYSTPGVTSSQK